MEALKSTQVLAPAIKVVKLTGCMHVTAKPLADHWSKEWSNSEYVKQQTGLQEYSLDHFCKTLNVNKDDVFNCSSGCVLSDYTKNGLFAAIEKAYSRHYHLHLRPDDLWLAISQGVSKHLRYKDNAEKYRSVFVDHEGKQEIKVYVDEFRTGDSRLLDWDKCVDLITKQLDKRVKGGASQLLVNDFSTTDAVSRTVSQIVLMDAMQQYFSYKMMLCCGIPQVTLHGSREDWQRLLEKARALRQLQIGLDWWLNELEPVLQRFLDTYEGRGDSEWWGKVLTATRYGSGGQYTVDGWLRFFFPYTDGGEKVDLKDRRGIDAGDVPRGSVECPFKLDDNGAVTDCQLVAGSFGVQITEDGGVAPCLGWLVRKV